MGRRSAAPWPHGLLERTDSVSQPPTRLAFSEHLLGIALFVAPVIWLTGNPVLAYDLAFILSYMLAGAGHVPARA